MAQTIRRGVGTFATREEAERALDALRDSGFNMADVSVVGRHEGETVAGTEVKDRPESAGGGAVAGVRAGGAAGALVGLLAGASALAVPGFGPVLAAGTLGTVLSSTLVGSAAGATIGGLGGALVGYGVPSEHADRYTGAVEQGGYLVVIDGTDAEVRQAESILNAHSITNFNVYDAPSGTYRDRDTTTY